MQRGGSVGSGLRSSPVEAVMSWVEFARASALVALLSMGCAGATPGDDGSRRGGVEGQPGAAAGAGGAAPTGSGAFGNPTHQPPAVQPGAAGSGGAGGAPGDCQVGVFCAPTSPDPDNCGTLRLEADVEVKVTPGNLLVIFDQSGSMDEDWMSGSKLEVAQRALVSALTPLQDVMTAGAIFFPSIACVPFLPPPPGGAVQPIEGPNQIPFQPATQFLAAWEQHWSSRFIGDMIGTPMQEAFDRADVAIQSAMLTGPLAVVAFTDGEPNCFTDPMLTMVPTATEPERASSWLADRNIKTYMVGLPGAEGVQILDQVAQSGGTMTYVLPDDPATLEAKLREVVQETVSMGFESCSINLTPAADVPDELLMIVEEPGVGEQQVPRDLGWSLSGDGAHVEITGSLCEAAMSGRFTSITFEYACPDAPPPPALPPID
jgi:hypothetical protein